MQRGDSRRQRKAPHARPQLGADGCQRAPRWLPTRLAHPPPRLLPPSDTNALSVHIIVAPEVVLHVVVRKARLLSVCGFVGGIGTEKEGAFGADGVGQLVQEAVVFAEDQKQ